MNPKDISENEAKYVKYRNIMCMLLASQLCTIRTTIDQILFTAVMLIICETVFLRKSATAKSLMLCAYLMGLVYVVLCSETYMMVVYIMCAGLMYECLSSYRGGKQNAE